MAARIVVLKIQNPIIPPGVTTASEWTWDGTAKWREYRTPAGDPIVVQLVTTAVVGGTTYALCIFWGLGVTRDNPTPATYSSVWTWLTTNGAIVASWPVALDGNGNLLTTALDADAGAAAVQVKANWPATWKIYLGGDLPGAPTGPRCVAEWVA